MKRENWLHWARSSALWIVCLAVAGCAASTTEDEQDLPVKLGSSGGCSLSASSQPSAKSGGSIRLIAFSTTAVQRADFYTGKSLTVAKLLGNVSDAFGKALNGAAAGSRLYTLGSLTHGGEAQFVAGDAGAVEVNYLGNSPNTVQFDRSEVAALKQLMDAALAAP